MNARGQSLVELALALPLLLALALAGTEFTRLAMARSELDAATAAAAAAAARAPSLDEATVAAAAAFAALATTVGLEPPSGVAIQAPGFARGATVTATARARFRLGFSGVPALAPQWELTSRAAARIEDWRSRPAGSP